MKNWNNLIDELDTKLNSMTAKDWKIWSIRKNIRNYRDIRDWAISEILRHSGNPNYIEYINKLLKVIDKSQLRINQIRQKNWYWEEI